MSRTCWVLTSGRLGKENQNTVSRATHGHAEAFLPSSHKCPGLFHSKLVFKPVKTKASETLSLSPLLETQAAIPIECEVTG